MGRARRYVGGIEWLPGELRWLLADTSGDNVQFLDGGASAAPASADGGGLTRMLEELSEAYASTWSLCMPGKVRAAVVDFPAMAADELEQASRWQAEKLFHVPTSELATDFEPLFAADPAATSVPSLLVSVRHQTVHDWVWSLTEGKAHPHRLEPVFSACTRALRSVQVEQDVATMLLHCDRAGGTVVVRQGSHVIFTRAIPPDPDDTVDEYSPVFSGDLGIRTVLESLLSCEDRNPRLQIGYLMALGDIDEGWAADAAIAARVDCIHPAAAPPGVPATLQQNHKWLVPFGTLLGGIQ